MSTPTELPTCKEYAEKVGFCCKDLFMAMRLVETQGEPNEGIGSASQWPWGWAYGPYQIERDYHTDAVKECGSQVPTRGGYGMPGPAGGRPIPGGEFGPAQTFTFPSPNTGPNVPSVRYSKELSEHIICCYMRKYNPDISAKLNCCAGLNGITPISHGHWSVQEFPDSVLPGELCNSKDLKDLQALAMTHNGGPTMRWNDINAATGLPRNWEATTGAMGKRAKNAKIYWGKVCRQFGAKDRDHPNALEICKCT